MTVKPITPSEIPEAKEKIFPDFVLEAFNHQIAKNFSNGSSTVYQENVVEEMLLRSEGLDRNTIFNEKFLDVEDIYRNSGWSVVYDKPAFNENYKAHFIFRKKK